MNEEAGVPHVGKQFVSSIIDHIQTLRENPDIGRMVPEFDEPKIRKLIHSPFRIIYLREKSSIHVVRLGYGAVKENLFWKRPKHNE